MGKDHIERRSPTSGKLRVILTKRWTAELEMDSQRYNIGNSSSNSSSKGNGGVKITTRGVATRGWLPGGGYQGGNHDNNQGGGY